MNPRLTMISAACMALAMLGSRGTVHGLTIIRGSEAVSDQTGFAGVISLSEEAQTLLGRAKEGIEREDWKLTVDSLQRIIDLRGEHVLTSDERTYESARRYAHRLIADLPPEGLEAYRLIHDGEAATLFRQARDGHEQRPLRTVIERYLCTSVGDDASILLADWLIDEGRFAEASGLLLNLRDLHPDPDVSSRTVNMRLAVCAAGMGQRQRAAALLSELALSATQPAGDVPPLTGEERQKILAQLEAIRSYAENDRDTAAMRDTPDWPMAGGSLHRQFLMPLVEPGFVTHMPNVVQLPIPDLTHGGEDVLNYMDRRNLLPVRHIASDGQILVAKGVDRLVAVDIGSFAELWTTEPIIEQNVPRAALTQQQIIIRNQVIISDRKADEGDAALDEDPLIWELLYDSVGSSVCIAGEKVLSVDWIYGPAAPLGTLHRGHIRGFNQGMSSLDTIPNQVVAWSIHDGSLLWKSETRIENAANGTSVGFEEVEFLAVPVPVGDSLLAPARVNTDLYAMLLDAKTGRLQKWIYLCGTGGAPFESLHALEPCVADGVAYIPSGRGLLFALDVDSWTVRWTVRYEASEQAYINRGWIPQPVAAVSDVVLLAPPDSDRLYCFARSGGGRRWDIAREQSRYLLAVTDKQLWLVGDSVRRISVETGETLSEVSVPRISGRGALSGERIYVPTYDGIVVLDAGSLQRLATEPMVDTKPLGNLLALSASLFSTDAFEVHRYVDIERGYAQALAKYEEDPGDLSRAVALAWIELRREEPQQAFKVLSSVAEPTEDKDKLRYESVVHLRVSALLDWASSGKVDDVKAIELLNEARGIARTTEDVVRSIIALGDYYERTGDIQAACREYASLALSDHGDEMYAEEGDSGLERLARREASLRIADARRKLSESGQLELDDSMRRDYLDPAVAERDRTQLRRIAETTSLGIIAGEAELTLGEWMAMASRFEQAEAHLNRVIQMDASDALTAEAMGWLAAMYLFPADFHLPAQAIALLDKLEQRYAEDKLPEAIAYLHPLATDALDAQAVAGKTLSGRELVGRLRERIDSDILSRHRKALPPFVLGEPQEPRVRTSLDGRPLVIRESRIESMSNMALMLVEEKEIEAHDADTWRVIWPAKLRLLGEMAVEPDLRTVAGNVSGLYQQTPILTAHGVVDGQTLIVNSEFGLHAIGLLTGRRLWSRPYHPPVRNGYLPAGSDSSIWAHRGYIVSVDARGKLEVAAADQGHRVQWSAFVPMRRWQWVLSRGDYVVAVDAPLERLDVFRLEDGRRLGECVFQQTPDREVNISVYNEVVCGPGAPGEIVAYELARPGVQRWRLGMPEGISRIMKPAPELLLVADEFGRLKMIDPQTGALQLETQIDHGRGGVFSAALEEGVLYVVGFKQLPEEPNQIDRQEWYVAAVEVRSGRVIWLRDGYSGVARHMKSDLLTAATNVIPVVQFAPVDRDQQNELSGRVLLSMLDKKTGDPIGEESSKQISREANAQWILDVQVWADKILVMTGSSVVVYPLDEKPAGRQSTRRDAFPMTDIFARGGLREGNFGKAENGWSLTPGSGR